MASTSQFMYTNVLILTKILGVMELLSGYLSQIYIGMSPIVPVINRKCIILHVCWLWFIVTDNQSAEQVEIFHWSEIEYDGWYDCQWHNIYNLTLSYSDLHKEKKTLTKHWCFTMVHNSWAGISMISCL